MTTTATTPLPDPSEQPGISVTDAGRILGVSRNTAYKYARTGKLPTFPVGPHIAVHTARFLAQLDHNHKETHA